MQVAQSASKRLIGAMSLNFHQGVILTPQLSTGAATIGTGQMVPNRGICLKIPQLNSCWIGNIGAGIDVGHVEFGPMTSGPNWPTVTFCPWLLESLEGVGHQFVIAKGVQLIAFALIIGFI